MSESIKPALTAEEWRQWLTGTEIPESELGETRLSIAATALYGQPFGFTRDDVTALRQAAMGIAAAGNDCDCTAEDRNRTQRDIDSVESLISRIEALLPPEKQ